jgi:hypothetical protein
MAVVDMARQQAAKQARGLAHPQRFMGLYVTMWCGWPADGVRRGLPSVTHSCLGRGNCPLHCEAAHSTADGKHSIGVKALKYCSIGSHRLLLRLQEAECFVRAASLPVHKALVWTFLAQRATQRVRSWLLPNHLGPQQVQSCSACLCYSAHHRMQRSCPIIDGRMEL